MGGKKVLPGPYPSDTGDRRVNRNERGCDSYSLVGERRISKATDIKSHLQKEQRIQPVDLWAG